MKRTPAHPIDAIRPVRRTRRSTAMMRPWIAGRRATLLAVAGVLLAGLGLFAHDLRARRAEAAHAAAREQARREVAERSAAERHSLRESRRQWLAGLADPAYAAAHPLEAAAALRRLQQNPLPEDEPGFDGRVAEALAAAERLVESSVQAYVRH